jgi:cytochrome P450
MDMTYFFAFQRYGTWWRRHRRGFHEHFHPNVIHNYHHIHLDTAREFVRKLLDSPEKFVYHARL